MPKAPKQKLYDFVVLPARGVYANTSMGSHAVSILHELTKPGQPETSLDSIVSSFSGAANVDVSGSKAFKFIVKRSQGKPIGLMVTSPGLVSGPIAVRASAEAERVLRSAGFRVLRQQKYRLIAPTAFSDLGGTAAPSAVNRRDFRSQLYLDAPDRQAGPLGHGVTIGVVDTGIDRSHPALAHAVTGGRCFVKGEDDMAWGPSNGPVGWHGTHVAGILAARDPGGRCPDGIAPEAKIRSYRVFGGGAGTTIATIGVINSILTAVDDGCDIINLSLGGRQLREDGVRDAINEAWDSGVVCIAAAGNDGHRPVAFPAAHPNCFGISALGRETLISAGDADARFVGPPRSAVDPDVFLATFSNIGPQIDFAGPGVAIVSTLPNNGIGAASGTSMAAPAVAGATAVALSRNSNILNGNRDKDRAAAIFAMLVGRAKPFGFGSFDCEGYGVPL